MEIDQNLLKKIEDYLMGNLKKEEVADFEKEMAVNVDLKEEVERIKLIRDSIEQYGDDELKKKLDPIHEEVSTEKSELIYYFNLKKMLAASAVLVFLVSSVFLLNVFDSRNTEDIYKRYYEAPQFNSTSRGSNKQLSIAESYYKEKDYTNAFLIFKEEKAKNPEQLNLVFYMAICAHEIGQYSTASALFEDIITENHPALADDAKWYISMNYINQDRVDEAKKYLEQLKNDSSSFYNSRANKILETKPFSN